MISNKKIVFVFITLMLLAQGFQASSLSMDGDVISRRYSQELPVDTLGWEFYQYLDGVSGSEPFSGLDQESYFVMEILGDLAALNITPSTPASEFEELLNFTYFDNSINQLTPFTYDPETIMFFLCPLEWNLDTGLVPNYFEYLDNTGENFTDVGPGYIVDDHFFIEVEREEEDHYLFEYYQYEVQTGILKTYIREIDYFNGTADVIEMFNVPIDPAPNPGEGPIEDPDPPGSSYNSMMYSQELPCERIEWIYTETFTGGATDAMLFDIANNTIIRMDITGNLTGFEFMFRDPDSNITDYLSLTYNEHGTDNDADFVDFPVTVMDFFIFLMPLTWIIENETISNIFDYFVETGQDYIGIGNGTITDGIYTVSANDTEELLGISYMNMTTSISHDISTGEMLEIYRYIEWGNGSTSEASLEFVSGCRNTEPTDTNTTTSNSTTSTETSTSPALDLPVSPLFFLGMVAIPILRSTSRKKR